MPTSQDARPGHPFFRRLASAVVGFGCLVTAGHVLSAVVKAPVHPTQATVQPNSYHSVFAVQSSHSDMAPQMHPLQALVCIHGSAMQITNNSPYPWHNLSAQVSDYRTRTVYQPTVCPVIAPYRTRIIALHLTSMSSRSSGYPSAPVVLRWECRTGKSPSHWLGYVPL